MKFRAVDSVPKRITKHNIYHGQFVTAMHLTKVGELAKGGVFHRIAVVDDTGKWMTFNPKIFLPESMMPTAKGKPWKQTKQKKPRPLDHGQE